MNIHDEDIVQEIYEVTKPVTLSHNSSLRFREVSFKYSIEIEGYEIVLYDFKTTLMIIMADRVGKWELVCAGKHTSYFIETSTCLVCHTKFTFIFI